MGRVHQFRGSDWKFVATSVSPSSQQQQEIPFCPASTHLERVHLIKRRRCVNRTPPSPRPGYPPGPGLFSHGWERAVWADPEQESRVPAFSLALRVTSEREEQLGDSPRQRAQTGGGQQRGVAGARAWMWLLV